MNERNERKFNNDVYIQFYVAQKCVEDFGDTAQLHIRRLCSTGSNILTKNYWKYEKKRSKNKAV